MNLKKNNNMNVPKKKANKNDVYAIILAILIIFWTIASVFGFIGYARSSKKDSGMITASADTVNTPDVVPEPYAGLINEFEYNYEWLDGFAFWGTNYPYQTRLGRNIFVMTGGDLTYNGHLLIEDGAWQTQTAFDTVFSGANLTNYTYSTSIVFMENYVDGVTYNTPDNILPTDGLLILLQMDAQISSINSGIYVIFTLGFEWYENLADSNPITFGLSFYVLFNVAPNNNFTGWTYIRLPALNVTTDSPTINIPYTYYGQYNKFYTAKQFYILGYQFNGGSSSNNGEYSFFNLISAVIDAPIQAFTSLFNFDLLGINLTSFFLALLSVAVFIAIIRLIL